MWRANLYVFGGLKKRQILVVDGCELTPKAELQFDVFFGACAQRDNAEVFICFENSLDSTTHKNCHRATGPLEKFEKLPSSTYAHENTRIAVTSGKLVFLISKVHD